LNENTSTYRTLTATPANQPDPSRIGMVRLELDTPFEHYCAVCGAWGAFGFGGDHTPEKPGVWFCGDHREEGEQRWRARS